VTPDPGRALNIVFDLGGVVVRWEPDAIIASAFADPAVQALVRTQILGHPDWLALDRATLTDKEVIARAAQRTGLPEPEVSRFIRGVPHQLVAIPDTVELLYRLKAKGHPLYCLSNMPAISIVHLEQAYAFWDVFTGVVISSRLQLCKPEPAIYEHLLREYGLAAAETVFIDDVDVNLTAARRIGMHAIRFESAAQCERDLRLLGCG
jgi:putative hydrolase of the HAD superfamily